MGNGSGQAGEGGRKTLPNAFPACFFATKPGNGVPQRENRPLLTGNASFSWGNAPRKPQNQAFPARRAPRNAFVSPFPLGEAC